MRKYVNLMKKIMLIFGTRPEAIKMSPLIKELQNDKFLKPIVVVTAQHRDMLDSVLQTFNIIPDHDLNIMTQNQSLSEITSKCLTLLENVVDKEKPDMILVHGDTTTTFVGTLVAFYRQITIGHVEAGLRTWDKYSPFPEEINRQAVGLMADLNFAPTESAARNLLNEQKDPSSICITGNTGIDAMKTTIQKNYYSEILSKYKDKKILLLTTHRRENIGEPMHNIFKSIRNIVHENKDVAVIYPMHKNPKVREIAQLYLTNIERVELIEPLDVLDFHNFANNSYMLLTDSGGIQEEAPSLNKPVLVLRNTTERPEGVKAGTLKVVGTSEENIYEEIKNLLDNKLEYIKMSKAQNPYGDGKASMRICENIKYYFNISNEKPEDFK